MSEQLFNYLKSLGFMYTYIYIYIYIICLRRRCSVQPARDGRPSSPRCSTGNVPALLLKINPGNPLDENGFKKPKAALPQSNHRKTRTPKSQLMVREQGTDDQWEPLTLLPSSGYYLGGAGVNFVWSWIRRIPRPLVLPRKHPRPLFVCIWRPRKCRVPSE